MVGPRKNRQSATIVAISDKRHVFARPWVIRTCLILQALCAIFFVGNIFNGVVGFGFGEISWQLYEVIEIGASIGLLTGIAITALVLRRNRLRVSEVESRLRSATGQFMDVVEDRFDEWGLSPAERDVALFTIKGMTTTEIAALRNTSSGTVKVQTNAVYRKAGVGSRHQLLSVFIDELMDGTAITEQPRPARAA